MQQLFARDASPQQAGTPGLNVEALRSMVDSVPAMLGYWGKDLRNRYANPAYLRWLGRSLEEVMGRSVAELLGEDFVQRYGPHLDGVLAGQRQDYKRAVTRADGSLEYHHVAYIPHWEGGQVEGFFVLTTDITELVFSQQTLERALQQKQTLLQEVYHRVTNNLQLMQSLLNLQRHALPEGAARASMQDMIERVCAMALLHEQLSRTENLSSVSLQRYVNDLLAELSQAQQGAAGRVKLHCDVPARAVGLDSAMPLGLLLTELITNCYKHAFPGERRGEIRVQIREEDGHATLTVSDDGVGLPAGFDPALLNSMGVRLALGLAQQLGGKLVYESAHGTTARLENAVL